MGACPSDLAGPECGGPPASTDELKEKQAKVRDAGVKATAAKKGLSVAETKLSGLQSKLSVTQEELDGADLRIAQKGEKVASAKPERKPAALQEVEIEKAKKDRLKAEKDRLNMLISSLEKDIAKLKTTSTDADTELTTAKADLSSAIQRASDEAAAKKATEEAAAAEAERLRQEEEVKAAAEAERLRQEEEVKAAAPAPIPLPPSRATDLIPVRPPTEGQLRRAAMEVPAPEQPPTPFQPPEIPEGLTPEQQRRAAFGGPVTSIRSVIPNKKCSGLVRRWLDYVVNDKTNITIDEVMFIKGKGVTDEELFACIDYFKYNKELIELPPKPWETAKKPSLTERQRMRERWGTFQNLPPNLKCSSIVRNWLDTYVKDKSNITKEEVNFIKSKGVKDRELRDCIDYFKGKGGDDGRIGFISELPPPATTVPPPPTASTPQPVPREALDLSKIVPGGDPGWGPVWGNDEQWLGKGRRRTRRRGGNEQATYIKQTRETIQQDVKSAVEKSPGVKDTAAKLVSPNAPKSLPKGGRRRTFRKKKTLRELEKKLDELKELISRSS